MAEIRVDPSKPLAVALAKFKNAVIKEGIMQEYNKHTEYTKPSVKRKLKSIEARKFQNKLDKKRERNEIDRH